MTILTLSGLEGSLSTFAPLLGWVARATLLFAIAGLASVLLARRSAALRHLVWTAAFGGVLVLPALGAVLPAWRTPAVALPRVWTDLAMQSNVTPAPEPVAAPSAEPVIDPATNATLSAEKAAECPDTQSQSTATTDDVAASGTGAEPPRGGFPWAVLPMAAFGIWILGSLLTLTWFISGHVTVRRIGRATVPAAGASWQLIVTRAARDIGFTGDCDLRVSDLALMPMTWGLLRPRVMLPVAAESWPIECRRLVLMHELAHVQRRDCLTQALAQFACALLWFHPLAWYGARRMRIERERACDDRVLAADTLASTYAGHLLDVVRALRVPPRTSAGAVSFAHPSQIEGRLLAVLRPGIDRRGIDRKVTARVLALAVLLALPLAALQPATAGSIAHQRARAAEKIAVVRAPDELKTLEDRVGWARNEAGNSGARSYWIGYSIEAAERFGDGVLGDTHDIDFATLEDTYPGARIADVLAFDGTAPDVLPGPVAILMHMKGKQIDRVRFQSYALAADLGADPLYWMSHARDQESIALLRRLRSESHDPDVASRLLESTGLHANSKLVLPELRQALENGSDVMRALAAEALGNHPQSESVEMLVHTARNDRSSDVRQKATEALGVIDSPAALDALVGLARSADEAVRTAAVEAVAQALTKDVTPAPEPAEVPVAPETPEAIAHPAPAAEGQPAPMTAPTPSWSPTPAAPGTPMIIPGRELSEGNAPAPPATVTPAVPAAPAKRRGMVVAHDSASEDEIEAQRQAVEELGKLPEEESLPQLLSIIDEHPSRTVRLQAVQSIATVGGSAAMSLVRKFAWQHPDEAVRLEAVQVLGHVLPTTKALSQLAEIAEMHPDDVTREQAVANLGQIETPGAFRVLKSIIESDPSDKVQRQAVEAIGNRSDDGVLEYLAETARTHPSRRVRSEAVDAIGRLDSEEAAALLDELTKKKEKKDKF